MTKATSGTTAGATSSAPLAAQGPRSEREKSLISSAYRVITRQGVHRTSLQEIAEDAGVSKGLLVYHFKSKDVVLITSMRWALPRTADRIRSLLAEADCDDRHAVQGVVR